MDAVLNWLWQGGVVAAMLSVTLVALKRAGANVRYVVCGAAALLVIGLPLLPAFQPTASIDPYNVPGNNAIVALPSAWWTSTRVMFGAAMCWVVFHMIRLLSAIVTIRRARRRSRTFPGHLESRLPHWQRIRGEGRRARLVLSNSITNAAVLGWGVPVIAVAPSLVRTLEADDLDQVLIHEWAHVQRRDDVVNVLQIVIRLVGGWHPALWWIDRRLHVEREIACDEIVVALTGLPKSYAKCLVKLSGLKDAVGAIQTTPAIFTPSGLRARLVKIVSPHQPIAPVWSRALASAIVLMLCLLSAAVGGVTLVEATSLAEPALSVATFPRSMPSDRPVPSAVAAPANARETASTRRMVARPSSPQRQTTEQRAWHREAVRQREPSASTDLNPGTPLVAVTPHQAADASPTPASAEALEARPLALPAPPQATPESARAPWTAAAAGGVTIGRKSKDAGVATAGFFTRFAKHVAGSF
jgi:beta-lactamase regulating signal transducer with metallopeptidase domain